MPMGFIDAKPASSELGFQGSKSFGGIAKTLLQNNMDFNCLRPFEFAGNSYLTVNTNKKDGKGKIITDTRQIAHNAATLRFEEWREIDQAVVAAVKPALRAVADLRSAGLTRRINGMGTPFLAYETMSDITEAEVSMSGLRRSEGDRPTFDITNLPIPIIHKDFQYDARQVFVSRRNGTGLDTTTAQLAARRVAEKAENMLIGNLAAYAYGGYSVYGYRTHPNRITLSMTLPTAPGWTPQTTVSEIISMKQSLVDNFRPGPYVLYTSSAWDEYLDNDYSAAYNGNTLRTRLALVDRITAIRTLDYLTGFQMLLVQMTGDNVVEVIGMDIRTLQWESEGGMLLNFKVMCIMVPWFRMDMGSHLGVAHGTAV